jgi:putative sterol carrier protein
MTPKVSEIMENIPAAFAAGASKDVSAVVHFKFTGAEPGEWNATIQDGACHVAPGLPRSRPTISVVADSSDFVKIASGELDATKAYMEGKIKVAGDLLLIPKLIKLFKLP